MPPQRRGRAGGLDDADAPARGTGARRAPGAARRGSSSCTSSGRRAYAAAAALDVRRPQLGQASRMVGRAREARSRPGRRRTATLEELGDRARRSRSAVDGSQRCAPRRRAAPGRSRPRRRGAQRAHSRHRSSGAISTRSSPASCRRRSRSCRSRCAMLATGAPPAEPRGLPLGPFRGDLDWPVAGTVRERFGRRPMPAARAVERHRDRGAEGTPVQAVHDGVVAFADTFRRVRQPGHPGSRRQTFSLYGNLLDMAVTRGARVERRPAASDRSGRRVDGTAGLYFELRVDGQPVDPLQWLKKRSVEVYVLTNPPPRPLDLGARRRVRDRRRLSQQGDGARRHLPAPQDLRRRREPDHQQLRRKGRRRQGDGRRDARPRRQPRSRQRLSVADRGQADRSNTALPAGDVGIDLTRQYYLRVIAARDGSPAAKAGPAHRRLRARHQRHADARDVGVRGHARLCAARPARRSAHDHSAATPTIRTSSS